MKFFSPFEVAAAEYLTKVEREHKAKIKQEAAEMKKEATKAKRAARTCAADGCTTYTNVEGGLAAWKKCKHCGCLFCKKHGGEFKAHVAECEKDDDSIDEKGMVGV